MKRLAFENLLAWKNKKSRKPLILRGARQVGKTWIVKKLGESFDTFVECNFEEDPELNSIFSGKLTPDHIVSLINNYLNTNITPTSTLLFFDEIQLCPQAIVSLRYFYEKMPDLHVIAAGSLLEFELENISIPVGRIEFRYIKPLTFYEFLVANNKSKILDTILNHPPSMPFLEPLHTQLLEEFKIYSLIGGMPESVQTYVNEKNVNKCQGVLDSLVSTFKTDFKKYAKVHQIKHLELVFNRAPFQQGSKFKYSNVSKDHKSRELKQALNLLCQADLFSKIKHSSSNGIPLAAESKEDKFKILGLDIGLSNRLMGLNLKDYVLSQDFQLINNGQISEAIVGQELLGYSPCDQNHELHYWHREGSSNAEVDYVVEQFANIIPVEIKDAKEGRLKSIYSFLERKKNSLYGVKISKANYNFYNNIQSIPFYGIMKFCLFPEAFRKNLR